MDRDKLQNGIVDDFCALEKRRALIVAATGVGKTKVALMVLKKLNPPKVLYLVESKTNRDVTAPDEFKKWEMEEYLDRTLFMTYQLAHKMKDTGRNLDGYFVIADEVDFAFTEEYGTFFTDYPYLDIFAMTGFVTPEKYKLFSFTLPMIVNITAEQMQEQEVLNKTRFIFVQFCLSKVRDLKIEYKKNGEEMSFLTSENDSYKFFVKQEAEVTAKLMSAISNNDYTNIANYERQIETVIPNKRAAMLWSLNSSVEIAKNLVFDIRLKDKNNKVITFSERTAQADKISPNRLHGKIKPKECDTIYDDFCSGNIMELATCSKVDRGANVPNLNYAIIESYSTEITKLHQRNGRLMRLDPSAVGTVYVLMPYYIEGENAFPTRAVLWARTVLKGLGIPKERVAILNLCGNYKINKE